MCLAIGLSYVYKIAGPTGHSGGPFFIFIIPRLCGPYTYSMGPLDCLVRDVTGTNPDYEL